MPATGMPADLPFRLALLRLLAAAAEPFRWRRLLHSCLFSPQADCAGLLYSANYILTTAGLRWALDPLTLHCRLAVAPRPDPSPLAALDVIVLSHRHADHFDPGLLHSLRSFSARWVVPDFLLPHLARLALPPEQVIIARPLEPLLLGPLTLTPFPGLHWEAEPAAPGGQRGVPAMGYLAEWNGRRWLFPGDTRTFDAAQLPDLGPVDGLFAHLWLGRGAALHQSPPLLESFCRFCLDLHPGQVVLAHLLEWGRSPAEMWTPAHARQAAARLRALAPGVVVTIARPGHRVRL